MTAPKTTPVILLLCLLATFSQAQKVKYKDLFVDLDAKKYETAIPALEAFLSEPKTADHANGNLQMGLYYESIVDKSDLIKDSSLVLTSAAQAKKYFAIAKEKITEKELKKNKDFYQVFYRRDLRTGEFGIKVSDVHLDIEKKIEKMESIDKYGNEIFDGLRTVYDSYQYLFKSYNSFTKQFKTYHDFLLIANQGQIDTLNEMVDKESILKDAFKDVRRAVSRVGKKGYSPELVLNPINAYGEDGTIEADMFVNDVETWQYGEWAYQSLERINGDIKEIKSKLMAFSDKLKAENDKINSEEPVQYSALTHVVQADIAKTLAELDEDPLPTDIYTVLIKKNEYDYLTNPKRNTRIGDMEDVDFQLMFTDSLVSVLELMEEDVEKLNDQYIIKEHKKYSEFVEREFGGDSGLIQFRKDFQKFLADSKQQWVDRNNEYKEKAKWGYSKDGKDTVFIASKSSQRINTTISKVTLATSKDDSSNYFVIGIDRAASGKGFMVMVSNPRQMIWKKHFSLGDFVFNDSIPLINAKFVDAEDGKVTAYLYSNAKPTKGTNLLVVHADVETGKVEWFNSSLVNHEPIKTAYNPLVKETIMYFMSEEEIDKAGPDARGYTVIDRSGKTR